MPEINSPPCPTHGVFPRALHSESFEGIVTVIEELISTVSGVGTTSFSRCPYGYPFNFEGVVRALEDLNTSISGISAGGGATGSGIAAGSGIYITQSGDIQIINATVVSASGISISAGSGIYLTDAGTRINLFAEGEGSVSISYDGSKALISGSSTGGGASVTVSGSPGENYGAGALWFDSNEGRLFIYASGNGVEDPDWYQTNAEALAITSEVPPSGNGGLNSPPVDGTLWFNRLMGNLFVYDALSSGWYETAPAYTPAYGSSEPIGVVEGASFIDKSVDFFKYWNGSEWVILGSGVAP